MSTGVAVLRTDGLSKRYGGVRALDSVSLQVSAHERVGLIGPNGAGKTTLVNCISGVVRPTSGSMYLDGHDISRWSRHRRARAGLIRSYQNVRLFSGLTVAENIECGLISTCYTGNQARARVVEALAEHHLTDVARLLVRDLSYGQQRQTEIARVLIAEPKVVVLDEPAAGLGERDTRELEASIRSASERTGCAVVLIDHDMNFVMSVSDRIIVMHEGALVKEGTPTEIRNDPETIGLYLGTTVISGA